MAARKIRPKNVLAYVRKLHGTNIQTLEKTVMGMSNVGAATILVDIDHEKHEDLDELRDTVTHEVVHRVHPTPDFDPLDPKDNKRHDVEEQAVEVITSYLLSHPVWIAALDRRLLYWMWDLVREARLKGVSFT